jgi:hypothetical protein
MNRWYPTAPEVSRETLVVIAGAIVAAIVFSKSPALKAWVADRLPTRALTASTGIPSIN